MVKWLDQHDVADQEHIRDLDTQAAIHEFQHKLPRHEAEKKAYDDYVRDRVIESAAWHLSGMRAAQGAGDMDAARSHGTLYTAALKQLGHPEVGEVPDEIASHVKHSPSKLYSFKGHGSDLFLGGKNKEKSEPKEESAQKEASSLAKNIARIIVDKAIKY